MAGPPNVEGPRKTPHFDEPVDRGIVEVEVADQYR